MSDRINPFSTIYLKNADHFDFQVRNITSSLNFLSEWGNLKSVLMPLWNVLGLCSMNLGSPFFFVNPFPNDKFVDWSKFEVFADDSINVT